MLNVVFTLDYEIHGNGEGCPQALMVDPTARLLRLMAEYGARLTIMADVAEILKFRQHWDTHGHDRFHFEAIAQQLCRAVEAGHDVQLHLHSSYFNSRLEEGGWAQDWSEYDFASLPPERMHWMVGAGKQFLESLLQPVDPAYRCTAFRAANWSVSPSHNVVRALVDNGIEVDTSVFKYGRRRGLVDFDYAQAHSALAPWPVSDRDVCVRDSAGRLVEVPIYSERRWIGAFLSAGRLSRVVQGRAHRLRGPSPAPAPAGRFAARWLSAVCARHAWKADFNQCGGRQLIRALRRAERSPDAAGSSTLPFVLIGHSKLCDPGNDARLRPLLAHVARHPGRFRFGTLSSAVRAWREEQRT